MPIINIDTSTVASINSSFGTVLLTSASNLDILKMLEPLVNTSVNAALLTVTNNYQSTISTFGQLSSNIQNIVSNIIITRSQLESELADGSSLITSINEDIAIINNSLLEINEGLLSRIDTIDTRFISITQALGSAVNVSSSRNSASLMSAITNIPVGTSGIVDALNNSATGQEAAQIATSNASGAVINSLGAAVNNLNSFINANLALTEIISAANRLAALL